MEAIKKIIDDKTIYDISGRVDTQTAPDLQDILDSDLDNFEQNQTKVNLVLNMKNVEYLSSAGLRTVLHVKKRLDAFENDSSLLIVNEIPEVREVFEMTGFTDFLVFGLMDENGQITENPEIETSESSE
ncbi:MAG: STAS domain-containing protein [Clostridia bacterium]|nr:STAS domain-containing protein [Clostridia bacterium]